ncbi:Protein of unknown function [Bacillus cereus]|nr:Protein of unknown function [Bacillus cereus]
MYHFSEKAHVTVLCLMHTTNVNHFLM